MTQVLLRAVEKEAMTDAINEYAYNKATDIINQWDDLAYDDDDIDPYDDVDWENCPD